MHRHRSMCNSIYTPYHHHHHHGMPMYSPYESIEPLSIPQVNPYVSSCCHDYPYHQGVACTDYPYCTCAPRVLPRPPIVHTNVHSDVRYYTDDPYTVYDDVYGNPYRLSRSKVQLVDLAQKPRPSRANNQMVVSTFQPRDKRETERVIYPRTNVLRNPAGTSYERQKRIKLVPLYHSAEPHYAMPNRHRSVVREIVPVATVADNHRQTIRVRSLSPL